MKANLVAILVAALVLSMVANYAQAREHADTRHALDTLASNELLRRVEQTLEWGTQVAEQRDLKADLERASARGDSLSQRTLELVQEIEALEGRVAVATEVNVNLAGALQAEAQRHVSEATEEPAEEPAEESQLQAVATVDSVTADFDDGLLEGRVAYYPPRSLFDLSYRARVRGSLITTELPDGRWAVFARAEHPRARLEIGSVTFDPPPPVQYCSIPTRGKWAGIGAVLWEILR